MKKLKDLSELASLKQEMVQEEWKDFKPNTNQIDEDEDNDPRLDPQRGSSFEQDYSDYFDAMVQRGNSYSTRKIVNELERLSKR